MKGNGGYDGKVGRCNANKEEEVAANFIREVIES